MDVTVNMKDAPACADCRGQCCVSAPMTTREFKTIRKRHGIPRGALVVKLVRQRAFMVVSDSESLVCAYLKDGRCSIYADRPSICRVYGDSELFPCKQAFPRRAEERMKSVAAIRRLWEGKRATILDGSNVLPRDPARSLCGGVLLPHSGPAPEA